MTVTVENAQARRRAATRQLCDYCGDKGPPAPAMVRICGEMIASEACGGCAVKIVKAVAVMLAMTDPPRKKELKEFFASKRPVAKKRRS